MDSEVKCFRLNYRVVNHSSEELIIKAKGGLGYIVKRTVEPSYNTTRKVYVELDSVVMANLLIEPKHAYTHFDRALLKAIDKERKRLKENNEFNYRTFTQNLRVLINLTSDLVEKNDAIHSEILGITMYSGMENLHEPSFNTPEDTMNQLSNLTMPGDDHIKNALHYFTYLNDPRKTVNTPYTNVMGCAVQIPVVHDDSKPTGLYTGVLNGKEKRQTIYYALADLNKKVFEELGLYETKADCENGGNTHRALSAEAKVKELTKDLAKQRDSLDEQIELLNKSEELRVQLVRDIANLKQDHKSEVQMLKHESKLEISQLKHQSKVSGDIFKYETRMKDTATKASMDFIKQKSTANNWGEIAKAVGAVATVAFTGYKLITA